MIRRSRTCASAPPICGGLFDFDTKQERLTEVSGLLESADVWKDPARAQELGKERKSLEAVVSSISQISSGLDDNAELFEMAKGEDDESTLLALESDVKGLSEKVETMEFRRMFSGQADINNCFVEIQAGAGGTEAQDWASMLLRQYLRYCERKGFKAELLDRRDGRSSAAPTATTTS